MRKNARTTAAILVAVMAVGMLTGCDDKAESPAGTQVADEEKKTLKVAMEYVYAPYNWTQPDDSSGAVPIAKSSEYAYDYDVMTAKKASEELGYDSETVRPDWDSLILTIQVDKVDCVITGQSITSERLETVDFSEPYYYTTVVAPVKEGSKYTDAKSMANLAGATYTSQQSTIRYDICLPQIADANILAVTINAPDMLISLQADKCDLVVTDQPVGKGALVVYPSFKLPKFGGTENDFQATDEEINTGISMRKGSTELKTAIDGMLNRMTKNDFSEIMSGAIAVQPLASQGLESRQGAQK